MFCGGSEGSDQERNSGTEGTLYDSEETFRKGTGTYPGGNRKSPLETREPVCSNFPACGGCMYQTMSYEDQLHMKETQIRELLEEALIQGGQIDENGNAAFEWEGIHGSPIEFGYRNKMEFSFGDESKTDTVPWPA